VAIHLKTTRGDCSRLFCSKKYGTIYFRGLIRNGLQKKLSFAGSPTSLRVAPRDFQGITEEINEVLPKLTKML